MQSIAWETARTQIPALSFRRLSELGFEKHAFAVRQPGVEVRVPRDEAGYVAMDVLQTRFGLRLSAARMLDVAALDEKSRFGVKKECRSFIRANQGHSVEGLCDDALLTRVTEDDLPPLGSPPHPRVVAGKY